ncbi:MAG TPA: hypothetical protein VGC75_05010 [Candidatus Nitrosocosmicus sp.]|jgi:hypothetical protein
MPDLLLVFSRSWKLIILIVLIACIIAFTFEQFSPKLYLSVTTALPANSITVDKARIYDKNVENLYSDIGTADELDKIEGTAQLDTIYLAVAAEMNLQDHYRLENNNDALFNAALQLKKNTEIKRSAYGELKIKVWDTDKNLAALLANKLLEKLQLIHQNIQNERNAMILQRLNEDFHMAENKLNQFRDSSSLQELKLDMLKSVRREGLFSQMQEDQKLIREYQLALNTNPQVLLVVEKARPSLWPDKPKTAQTIAFTFFISLFFGFLMALFNYKRIK